MPRDFHMQTIRGHGTTISNDKDYSLVEIRLAEERTRKIKMADSNQFLRLTREPGEF